MWPRRDRQYGLVAGIVLSLYFLFSEMNQGTDTADYMVLLRSVWLDGDLFLANEFAHLGLPIFVTTTGYPVDIANFGIVFFWMPFYLVGYLLLHLGSLFPGNAALLPVSGLEPSLLLWLKVADWFYGMLALGLIFLTARRLFGVDAARFGSLAALLATPFAYYMGPITPSTHAVSIFLSSLFVYQFLVARDSDGLWGWAVLGWVGGTALMVANTNLGLIMLPAIHFLLGHPSVRWLRQGVVFGLSWIIGFLPQLLVLGLFMGNPFRSPYGAFLSWRTPHLIEIFFSSYHGLYFYAPVLLLATAGLFLLLRQERVLALGGLLMILLTAYLGSINIAWWAGGAFGARYLLGATPIFAMGLASISARARRGWQRRAWCGLVALGSLWTLLLYLPYKLAEATLSAYYPPREQLALMGEAGSRALLLVQHLPAPLIGLWLVLLLPLTLLALLLRPLLARVISGLPALLARRGLLGVPLLLLLFTLLLLARSEQARASCQRAACDQGWIASDFDRSELAYNYVERAFYHSKRDEWGAAIDDMQQAAALSPTDQALQQILDQFKAKQEAAGGQ